MIDPPDGPVSRIAPARALPQLTAFAHQLAGSLRTATMIQHLAHVVDELLAPDRVQIALLDVRTNQLTLVHSRGTVTGRTDDPLVQLALRRGPLALASDVRAAAARAGADPGSTAPASWLGVPVTAAGRAIGAISLGADRRNAFDADALQLLTAVAAQTAIALENARLVDLLAMRAREWELAVDNVSHAICIVDARGIVRRANRAFGGLLDIPAADLPERAWLDVIPPAWADVVARALARPEESPLELHAGERVLMVSAAPTAVEDAAGTVVVFEDQTDKRRLQEQLIQSEKMSALGQLIAGIAHDLNNPLASVVGFSDFLAEASEIPLPFAEPLRVIRQEAERAATIVRNLLSFARRQAERRQTQPIGPLLESVLALLRNQLMALRVDAHLVLDHDLPEIEININQIKQVFVNLINNAAQAMAASGTGGEITITARRWRDGVAVTVADDGPGLSDEVVARAFEPFFTTKPEGEGTGLGLSISQGIVKEHGGRITVETVPQHGATFTVEIPRGTATAPTRPTPPGSAPEGSLRVLVVDDEPHILHYMQATLETWGHTVELASDGAEGLARATASPFDVIICDLRMPGLGGRDVYRDLQVSQPAVAERIVFATGDTVRGDTLQFLESLGRPYLHKPFTLAELRAVLADISKRTV